MSLCSFTVFGRSRWEALSVCKTEDPGSTPGRDPRARLGLLTRCSVQQSGAGTQGEYPGDGGVSSTIRVCARMRARNLCMPR